MVKQIVDRRNFLRMMGIGAAGAATVLGPSISLAQDSTDTPATDTPALPATDWRAMDAHHEAGVKTFLGNIGKEENYWRKPLDFTMDGDTKVFKLEATEMTWETMPGTGFPAMAYNGMVPGPEFRVTEGDKIRIEFTNKMTQSTAIHFHGLRVPNPMDGVPFITQKVVER